MERLSGKENNKPDLGHGKDQEMRRDYHIRQGQGLCSVPSVQQVEMIFEQGIRAFGFGFTGWGHTRGVCAGDLAFFYCSGTFALPTLPGRLGCGTLPLPV